MDYRGDYLLLIAIAVVRGITGGKMGNIHDMKLSAYTMNTPVHDRMNGCSTI